MKNIKYIFITAIFLFQIIAIKSNATTVFIIPQSQDIFSEDTFIVDINIDSENKKINVIEGHISFDQDKFEVTDIITGDSILSLWVENPSYSNENGKINFIGGITSGFQGQGKILSIFLKVNKTSSLKDLGLIKFDEDFKVLLHDGKGTPDFLNFIDGNYKIIEKQDNLPIISSNSHKNQDKWYSDNSLHLSWDLIENSEYSFLISRSSIELPDEIADKPEGEMIWMGDMSYKGLNDGIYYFHLKQKLPNEQWSQKVTFRAMIDTTKPEDLSIQIADIEGRKHLIFFAKDTTSGIDHFEMTEIIEKGIFFKQESKEKWKTIESPYLLSDQELQNKIKIKVIDKAGNENLSEITPVKKSSKLQLSLFVSSLFLILIILWIFIKLIGKRNKK